MNNIVLSSLLFVSSTLLSILVFYGIRKRDIPGVFYFSVLMTAMIEHSIGYAFELLSSTVEQMYLCIRIEYLGVAFYPFLILLFAREYTDEKKFAKNYLLVLILVINTLTLILVNTNSYHWLYYSSVGVDHSPGFSILALEKGPWYMVQVASLFFSIFYSVVIFSIKLKKTSGNYRKKVGFMLIGVSIPMGTLIIYMLGLGPVYIDVSPFSYFFMSLCIIIGLLRYDILLLAPITHEMVFNSIAEAVLVVDRDSLLINFNSASKVFFPSLSQIKIGDSISMIDELKDYHFDGNQQIYEMNGIILSFKVINIKSNRIYVATDITESEHVKKQLEILATEDALTGLYNRRYFMEKLQNFEGDGVFIIMDIDHFKSVNDTMGHAEGDKVLAWFGEELRKSFRDQVVCRYGGEEFAVFIENLGTQQAYEQVEALRKGMDAADRPVKVTFSAGLAAFTKENISDALICADQKLYEAKEKGRNQACY